MTEQNRYNNDLSNNHMKDSLKDRLSLWKHKSDVNEALDLAVLSKNTHDAKFLIEQGGNVNYVKFGSTLLNLAVYNRDIEMTKLLVDKGANLTLSLFKPIENNDVDIIKLLLAHGADVNEVTNAHCCTPFTYAIKLCNLELMALFMTHKANFLVADNSGHTAYDHIIFHKDETCARELFKVGLGVDSEDTFTYHENDIGSILNKDEHIITVAGQELSLTVALENDASVKVANNFFLPQSADFFSYVEKSCTKTDDDFCLVDAKLVTFLNYETLDTLNVDIIVDAYYCCSV